MMRETLIVVSEGDAFTRGRQLSRAAADRVEQTIASYMTLFARRAGLERGRVLAAAEQFMPAIEGYAPHLLEEMRGIAAGSGRDLREIVAINARTELMYGLPGRPECTSVAVSPAASADGHVRVAQNWDWFATLAGTTVLWVLRRDDGPDVLTFVEAGIVGKIGVNAAGLALCVNLLTSDSDNPGPAIPMHVVLRRVLDEARSVEQAIALIAAAPRCTSCNHLLADRSGAIADVEATPAGQSVLRPRGGVLTHANHCADADLFARDRGARDYPETVARGERARALAQTQSIDEPYLRAIMADHATAPGSICLHVQQGLPPEEREESIASVVIDLTAATMDLADGLPCSAPYRRVEIADYLRQPASIGPRDIDPSAGGRAPARVRPLRSP